MIVSLWILDLLRKDLVVFVDSLRSAISMVVVVAVVVECAFVDYLAPNPPYTAGLDDSLEVVGVFETMAEEGETERLRCLT